MSESNINRLLKCLDIVKRIPPDSIYYQAIDSDIDELTTKIIAYLELQYGTESPFIKEQIESIAQSDTEHNNFIRDSLPILLLLHNIYEST